jgi:hypothetical protein
MEMVCSSRTADFHQTELFIVTAHVRVTNVGLSMLEEMTI